MSSETAWYGESRVTRVSWGAVFSGVFVFLGLAILFILLGSAIGLTWTSSVGTSTGMAIYAFVAVLISFFVAGYAASRLSRAAVASPVSILHSVSVWGVVLALFAYLIGSGVGGLVSRLSGVIGEALPSVSALVSASQAGGVGTEVSAAARRGLRREARNGGGAVIDRRAVEGILAQRLHISRAEADRLIERSSGGVSTELRQAGGKAVRVGAQGGWYAFFLFLCGGLAAIFGGLSGFRRQDEAVSETARPPLNRRAA